MSANAEGKGRIEAAMRRIPFIARRRRKEREEEAPAGKKVEVRKRPPGERIVISGDLWISF